VAKEGPPWNCSLSSSSSSSCSAAGSASIVAGADSRLSSRSNPLQARRSSRPERQGAVLARPPSPEYRHLIRVGTETA